MMYVVDVMLFSVAIFQKFEKVKAKPHEKKKSENVSCPQKRHVKKKIQQS
jgi:hypothetical protein